MFTLVSLAGHSTLPAPRNYPCLPSTCDPSPGSASRSHDGLSGWETQLKWRRAMLWACLRAGLNRSADVDSWRLPTDTNHPSQCGSTADESFSRSDPLAAAAMTLPAPAQTPPAPGLAGQPPADAAAPRPPPAARPPARRARRTAHRRTAAAGRRQRRAPPPPVPLPSWFAEIDINKKGEVTRADFLKYRMKSFEQLDVNKDGKLTVEEFLKVAEPPCRPMCPTSRRSRSVVTGPRRIPEPRHQPRRLRRARRGRGAGPCRVQPVRHRPRQQGDRARGASDRAALDAARGRRAPADRGSGAARAW